MPNKMSESKPSNTIIIRKINIEEGRHGGAWKIALADMMTAMMAFFLVLWLISATDEATLKGIANHFKVDRTASKPINAGADGFFGGVSMLVLDKVMPEAPAKKSEDSSEPLPKEKSPDSANLPETDLAAKIEQIEEKAFRAIEERLTDLVSRDPTLAPALNQVEFIREKEGMRIQIVDEENSSMFDLGTDQLLPAAVKLLNTISSVIGSVENSIIIRGHTDSLAFTSESTQNNWLLSTQRAEATRFFLESAGIAPSRFVKIEGVADIDPYIAETPLDPRNRRINIILKYQSK
jgi:chemotaxis protein MotB